MDLNKVMLIGRLVKKPEIRSTSSGQNVASFSVVTNRYWTDKNGQKQEKAEFHNVVVWGRLADIAGQYLDKGKKIYIEGRLQTRDWEGQDGNKRYRTEVVADNFIMLDKSGGGSDSSDAITIEPVKDMPVDEVNLEDIPF
jgi:single-strand DNA-binding protein